MRKVLTPLEAAQAAAKKAERRAVLDRRRADRTTLKAASYERAAIRSAEAAEAAKAALAAAFLAEAERLSAKP